MLDDPDNLRFTRVPEPVPPGFAQAWLEIYEEERRTGTREAFAIVGDDGAFLGLALAPKIDRETRTAELGYVVAPEARGRGVATEALRRLTAWAFEELEMVRLESCDPPISSRAGARTPRSGHAWRPIADQALPDSVNPTRTRDSAPVARTVRPATASKTRPLR
jgi:GNAT superfamily N-acetyltransferase